jgi:hypothetical protein
MEKNEAEGILQISSDSGVVRGDRFWQGDDLYFTPIAGWTAGIRYTLSISGTIQSADGRDLRIERFVSFYAINKNKPPLLEWYAPVDGASVGTAEAVIELRFSRPMDRLTVESALIVEGMSGKTYEWLADDTALSVIPDNSLSPWITCRWTLKESAKSRDGVPLSKTFSGQFTTDRDRLLPEVSAVFPALYSDGRWFPTGADIAAGLGQGQAIAVEFNKAMDENTLRCLRFEPALSGRAELLSEKSIIYIFTKDPEPLTSYTLIVSGDAKDSEGLKIGTDFRINFVPDIPFLNILSFNIEGRIITEGFLSLNDSLTVQPDPVSGVFSCTIRFSLPFGHDEKQNTALKIPLIPFFPGTLAPVALQSVHWVSDDRLRITWEGLIPGNSDEAHYYKLTVPGGKGGISSGPGMYMREDINLFWEAIR